MTIGSHAKAPKKAKIKEGQEKELVGGIEVILKLIVMLLTWILMTLKIDGKFKFTAKRFYPYLMVTVFVGEWGVVIYCICKILLSG